MDERHRRALPMKKEGDGFIGIAGGRAPVHHWIDASLRVRKKGIRTVGELVVTGLGNPHVQKRPVLAQQRKTFFVTGRLVHRGGLFGARVRNVSFSWSVTHLERVDQVCVIRRCLLGGESKLDSPHLTWKLRIDPAAGALFRETNRGDLSVRGAASDSDFIARSGARERIRASTEAVAVEMNLEGLAPMCADHRVPLCAIRIISDLADEKATETFRNFVKKYDRSVVLFAAKLIEQVSPTKNDLDAYPNLQRLIHDSAKPK